MKLREQIEAYDEYIQSHCDLMEDGWTPVCFDEFVENDLREMKSE